ncbi:MAG: formylglycine-generating enzyme family protein [Planctomycetes bacterium]|nr:formylglycine-generating enzyme family protein [Planctomycetota bacterium]
MSAVRRRFVVSFAFLIAACSERAAGGGAPVEPAGDPAGEIPVAAPSPAAPSPAGPEPGEGDFTVYRQPIGETGVDFEMVPIPAGGFLMGSPETEVGRDADEGPQIEVAVEAFWMGRCEVTWAEYDRWNEDEARPQSKKPDGMARPTPAYMDMTFNMGRDGYPAICMSHIAARRYCKWLSEQTGHFYRLPTEAEWEYACRAGTKTPYSCDAAELDGCAWHDGNSARELARGAPPQAAYHKVGEKLPNPWGLHDMHGNVAEWVADTYLADAYDAAHGAAPRAAPYFAPPHDSRDRPVRFPHVARGGSWKDGVAMLRSASRQPSEKAWNYQDPQIPKSWWYLTDGQHVGFRIVRPYAEPDAAERARFEEL